MQISVIEAHLRLGGAVSFIQIKVVITRDQYIRRTLSSPFTLEGPSSKSILI